MDPSKMGHHARKRYEQNIEHNIKFDAEKLLTDVKDGHLLPVKLTK